MATWPLCTCFPRIRGIGSPIGSYRYVTMHVSGALYLRAGDRVRLSIFANRDTFWYSQGESSWSLVRIADAQAGFAAELRSSMRILHKGFAEVDSYRTTGSIPNLFEMGGISSSFSYNSGRFTAPIKGQYVCSANTRIDNMGSGVGTAVCLHSLYHVGLVLGGVFGTLILI